MGTKKTGKDEGTEKAKKDVKEFTDFVSNLNAELELISKQEGVGIFAPKEADIARVKAFEGAMKGLFEQNGDTPSSERIQKLVFRMEPILERTNLDEAIKEQVNLAIPEKDLEPKLVNLPINLQPSIKIDYDAMKEKIKAASDEFEKNANSILTNTLNGGLAAIGEGIGEALATGTDPVRAAFKGLFSVMQGD